MSNDIFARCRLFSHEGPESAFQHPPTSATLTASNPSAASITPQLYHHHFDPLDRDLVKIEVPLAILLTIDQLESQRYILQQAASFLGLSFPSLIELTYQSQYEPSRKRARLDLVAPDLSPRAVGDPVTMSSEKAPLLADPTQITKGNRKPFFGSFADASLSCGLPAPCLPECLGGFSLCSPCSPPEPSSRHEVVSPPSAGFDVHPEKQAAENSSVPHSHGSARDNHSLIPCDNGAGGLSGGFMPQYMSNFHDIHHHPHVLGVQPSTSGESMIYPATPPALNFVESQSQAHYSTLGSGIQAPNAPPNCPEPVTHPTASPTTGGPLVSLSPRLAGRRCGVDNPCGPLDCSRSTIPDMPSLHYPLHKAPIARRGPFKDPDQREKTAQTRRIGSCIRCRMQRIRCVLDPESPCGPCLTCKNVTPTKIWRLECLRWKITDVRLFKPGQVRGHEWTKRWRNSGIDDISAWASPELRWIRVTEGYTGQAVELGVRQFAPQPGDRLERSWISNGVAKSVAIPTFAIVDMRAAKASFDGYIKRGVVDCCKQLLAVRDSFLWHTYDLAIRMSADSSVDERERALLSTTLELWMSIRLTTKSFEIVGEEKLGMPANIMGDENNTMRGKIPLPPVMGAQIDAILIHELQPLLRRRTLERLQTMTQEKKQKTWLTTYLVSFMLLHNIALIIKHDEEYTLKHGIPRRFARENEVREYHHGANVLLAYFHYCNKGIYPFTDECREQDLRSLASLDETGIKFVRQSRAYIREHDQNWQALWNSREYSNEYYYLSQMFEPRWQPRDMVIS